MFSLFFGVAAVVGAVVIVSYLVLSRVAAPAGPLAPAALAAGSRAKAEPAGPSAATAVRHRAAGLAARLSRSDYAQRAQARLNVAGNPREWGPDSLLAAKGFGLVLGVLFGLVFGVKHGGALAVAAPLALGVFGLFLPDIYVHNCGEKRQIEVLKGLPDTMDMMTVCVEAGLGFDAALGRVARNLKGPMAEECARVLQEMQYGMSRAEALHSLLTRTTVPELRVFVSAIIQSSELGISVGDVLREQAKQMRVKRRHNAEEKAQKLQVKMLFPLITTLLPAMFVVILGPAIIQIGGFFQQSGK